MSRLVNYFLLSLREKFIQYIQHFSSCPSWPLCWSPSELRIQPAWSGPRILWLSVRSSPRSCFRLPARIPLSWPMAVRGPSAHPLPSRKINPRRRRKSNRSPPHPVAVPIRLVAVLSLPEFPSLCLFLWSWPLVMDYEPYWPSRSQPWPRWARWCSTCPLPFRIRPRRWCTITADWSHPLWHPLFAPPRWFASSHHFCGAWPPIPEWFSSATKDPFNRLTRWTRQSYDTSILNSLSGPNNPQKAFSSTSSFFCHFL